MAWSKTEQSEANGFVVHTETITLVNTIGGKTQTATINFLPAGEDFTVWATDNDDVAAACDVNMLASYDNSTFAAVKTDLATGLDNNTKVALYDVSANGAAPQYQVEVENNGTTAPGASKTVTVAIAYVA